MVLATNEAVYSLPLGIMGRWLIRGLVYGFDSRYA